LELIGHRGCRGLSPENTIEGFARAAAIGVDAVELDVGLTSDGVVVAVHDPALNPSVTRAASGAWLSAKGPLVRSQSFTALQAFDVGRIRPKTAYAAAFPDQVACDGARIPSLAAVLRSFPALPVTIEIKTFPPHPGWTATPEALAEAVTAVLDETIASARSVIQSFDWRVLRHLRTTRPALRLGWLTSRATERFARLWWDGASAADFGGSVPRAVAAEGGRLWVAEDAELNPADLTEAHELGLHVIAWTVNAPARMRELADWGVDGLITDRPDLARTVWAPRAAQAEWRL
jgi:glycerophosphoryl diester phosphodiesterase